MKILIAYGTMAGSTKEVAETVGEELKHAGLDVDILPVEGVKNLSGYDALVLGSAVRAFHLLPKTTRFLRKFKKAIQELPTAAFLVCLVMTEDTPERRATATKFAKPIIKVKQPVALGLFGGVMDPSKLTGYALGMFKNSAFKDNRDWNKIRAWSKELISILSK